MNEGQPPQKAFFNACEDENMYGDVDYIVDHRVKVAKILKSKYRITVDPIQGF